MRKDRRDFVKSMSVLAGGMIALPSCGIFNKEIKDVNVAGINNFGLQLYTLRDEMPKDPKGVLSKVASYGYKQIESYEGDQGIFWGMKPLEFKKYVGDLGMEVVASHCDIGKDFEKKAAQAAEAGMKYLICPWIGPQKSIDNYKKFADTFNEKGNICKANGIRFAYHNHDYSFRKMNGVFPQDIMMEIADPELVDFELDMYWVVAAGEDIEKWLKKYKGRFKLCHIKDYAKTPGTDNGKNSVDLGTGIIDWTKILKTAHDTGMKYYIVEQEAYPGGSPLKAVETNAGFMKNLAKK